FAGIAETLHKTYTELTFTNGEIVKCSKNHVLWTSDNDEIKVEDVMIGMKLKADGKPFVISDIKDISHTSNLLDIIEVDNEENSFLLANKLKSHNCQFLSFEKILIDSDHLDFLQTPEVTSIHNGFTVYKDSLDSLDSFVIITIDPSAGGEDSSVMQLWEVTPKKIYQLGTIADPDLDASGLFEKILWMQDFLREQWNYDPQDALIMFERNGVGEGLSQILTQTEKATEFLEIPIYYDSKNAGVQLTPPMKKKLALQFKNLVEYSKIQINDPELIDELYGFIRNTNGSYSAKSGYHDDRIMAAFYLVYYIMNVFAEFADGEFSLDHMMLVKEEDRIKIDNKVVTDPAAKYRERVEKEKVELELLDKKILDDKAREREQYAQMAQMGSSIVEEDDDDDIDLDSYDILPSVF
ncbi:MAG: hypothetical protein DRH57_08525, partial [Candidatus Cloacimonadota bacterium]